MLQAAGTPRPCRYQSLAAEYGIELDVDSVPRVCERFGLTFG
jgi:hypothetical protein